MSSHHDFGSTSGGPSAIPVKTSPGTGTTSTITAPALSLARNVSWTLTANIIDALCQWGILVVLAKLSTPELVGQFGIAYAIGAPVIMLTSLHLRQIQATDARGDYLFGHFLALRIFSSILAFTVIALIAIITNYPWPTKLVILAVGIAKVFDSIEDIAFGLLQKHERMDRMAVAIIAKAGFELSVMALAVYFTRGIFVGILGLILVRGVLLFTYDRWSVIQVLRPMYPVSSEKVHERTFGWHYFRPICSWNILAHMTWLSLPVAIAVTLHSLNVNIPRYFISHYLNDQNLGIFVALSYIVVGGNMVIMALSLSFSPRLSKYYAYGNRHLFRRLVLQGSSIVLLLGLSGVLFTYFCGRQFLALVYHQEYANHVKVLSILMVAAALQYLHGFLRQVMTAARYLIIQLPMYVLITIVLCIGCWQFVPTNGLIGACHAILCSSIIALLLSGSLTLYIIARHKGS